jgi:hypothetical protein
MVCVRRLSVLALLILVFTCGPAPATDHEHLPADLALRRTVYYLLSTHPELKEGSCGLSVYQGGIVVLWGVVPSQNWLDTAMRAIRDLDGVNKVVNKCQVTPPPDPALERFQARLNNEPVPPPLSIDDRPDPFRGVVVAKPMLPPVSLRDICDQLRQSDDRYSGLLFEVRMQKITLTGTVLAQSHLEDFTKRLRPYAEGRTIDTSRVRVIHKNK